jgi:GNAT superfamily N-acetyltransferase
MSDLTLWDRVALYLHVPRRLPSLKSHRHNRLRRLITHRRAHCVRTPDFVVAEIAVEVVDDWQRRGVGRLMVAELRTRALRAGCRRWEWLAFESSRAAAALACHLRDIRRNRVGAGIVRWSAAICCIAAAAAARIPRYARSVSTLLEAGLMKSGRVATGSAAKRVIWGFRR